MSINKLIILEHLETIPSSFENDLLLIFPEKIIITSHESSLYIYFKINLIKIRFLLF